MIKTVKPIYETHASGGKLVFKITSGQFAGIEYVYEELALNGDLKYKIRGKKNHITDSNKILFESEIRNILRDKLSSLKS